MISKLKNKGISGLGIQLGYYIDSIPEHMIIEEQSFTNRPIKIDSVKKYMKNNVKKSG